jgi:hypothetical protein
MADATKQSLSCPFCGGSRSGVFATTRHVEQAWYFVSCADCQAGGPWRTTPAGAAVGWDARATGTKDEVTKP